MIGLPRGLSVFAMTEPVDMRKSFDTLGALVTPKHPTDARPFRVRRHDRSSVPV